MLRRCVRMICSGAGLGAEIRLIRFDQIVQIGDTVGWQGLAVAET